MHCEASFKSNSKFIMLKNEQNNVYELFNDKISKYESIAVNFRTHL